MTNKPPSRGALMLAMMKDMNEKTVKDCDTNLSIYIVNINVEVTDIQNINCSEVIFDFPEFTYNTKVLIKNLNRSSLTLRI